MALVEVDDIELGAPQPGKIRAFAIDAPRIGGRNVYDIEVAGWALGARSAGQGDRNSSGRRCRSSRPARPAAP